MFHARLRNVFLASSVLLCAAASAGAADLEALRSAGSVRIATAEGMPMSGLGADGKINGYSGEIVQKVFDALGVAKIEPTVLEYQGLIPGLQADRWDMVAAGLDMTAPRCKVVLYTHPVVINPEGIAVKKGNPKNIKGHDDFVNNPDLILAVIAGSSQAAYARDTRKVPAAQILEVPTERGIVDAVIAGRADAGATGLSGIELMTDNDKDRDVIEPVKLEDVPSSAAGFLFRKEDKAFRDAFDTELDKLRTSGELSALAEKWKTSNELEKLKTVRRADILPDCE